ncbi:AraC family transcriptional regulator [Flavobacterium sp.]|nr:AraC family transcriptional regulator [Flavobacterium sp.]
MSEIAYSVGFNDVSYFSKCFKEVYNVTPSEYLSKK